MLLEEQDLGAYPGERECFTVAVIPAHNEERFIGSVVLAARQSVDHVIVVDDGSTDRTASLADAAGADVIKLDVNQGKGAALNVGFARAMELEAAAVVCLDGDSQHDPDEIPALMAPILEGDIDIVVGSRFMGAGNGIPLWRRFGQHALTAVTNATSGVVISDSQSGFRAFSRRALQELYFSRPGLAMESEMQFLIERSELRLLEVPISVHYLDGNKRNPVVHGLQVVDAILSLVARRRPLAFLGIPGVLLVVSGLVLGLWVVNTVNSQHVVPYGTAILCSLLITVGLVMALAGVILNTVEHLIGRVREDVRESIHSLSGPVPRASRLSSFEARMVIGK